VTRLIRSELLKIRTTNTWWIFSIGLVVVTGLALTVNCIQADLYLQEQPPSTEGMTPEQAAQVQAQWAAQHQVVTQAANIFTSGQFLGGLFVLLLGMLMITNEYYHQTATATFLTTPHRTTVVIVKLITAILFSGLLWLISTVIDLVVGVIFFRLQGLPNHLGDWPVQRAILFNLLVFALWAVLGVGFGALIRNQIGATVTGSLLYVVGSQLVGALFFLVYSFWIKEDWVLTAQVVVPATAAQIFVSPVKQFPQSPPYWVGGLVLLGYGLVAGIVGTLILRRRDVS
jgi:ABC-2 type transport system permease protein